MNKKLLGIVSAHFNVTYQILILHYA